VAVNVMDPGSIRVDPDLRARVGLNEELIGQMVEALEAGNWFPPVDVFFDGSVYWLADGFHRHPAHARAGKQIRARVHRGTRDDAALFACGANKAHNTAGLRMTNADKRRAVEKTLKLKPEWGGGLVADHCGVTPQFARKVRRELEQSEQGPPGQVETISTCPDGAGPAARQGLDGKTYPVKSAGRRDTTQDGFMVRLRFARADHEQWKEMVALAMKDFNAANDSDAVFRVLEHYARERGRGRE
jgi:hypothetical protein